MTLDECIAYLENIVIKRKSRSRKAKQILKYLYELKTYREDEWKKQFSLIFRDWSVAKMGENRIENDWAKKLKKCREERDNVFLTFDFKKNRTIL